MVSLVDRESWLSRKISAPARVRYCAFEDSDSFKLRAFCSYQYKLTKKTNSENHTGYCEFATKPPNIFEPLFERALEDEHSTYEAVRDPEEPDPPHVLIIDTLALAMSGFGDENSSATMGKVVDKLRQIRDLGTTVIVVHHSGKDLSKGLRGHNSLEAAADSIFSVQKKPNSNLVNLKRTHHRNGPAGEVFSFEIKTGVLKDRDKGEYLGAYLNYIENSSRTEKENILTKPQILVLNSLQRLLKTDPTNVGTMFGLAKDHLAVSYLLLAEDCKHQNIAPNGKSMASVTKAIKRAIEGLVDSSLVAEKDGFIWPTPLEQTEPDNTENS